MNTIALDAMGGDFGPEVVVPASLNALKFHESLKLILVGQESEIKKYLPAKDMKRFISRIDIHHTDEFVLMNELPSTALRVKKKSSMRVAINLVKEKHANACVSAGNTGALMAVAHFVLKTITGIDRAAIISNLPTIHGKCRVLDLGANVDSCTEHLLQFALMGSVLAQAIDGISSPKIGLLNIGVEEIKGNDQVKRTAQLLSNNKFLNYIGYVEGDDIFKGTADVIVCDGFVGNVALKASEGIARLIKNYLETAFRKNIFTRCSGMLAIPIFKSVFRKIDPARHNGATLVGLNGIVIKSHGSANLLAFENAIHEAVREIHHNVPELITEKISEMLIQAQ